MLYFCPSLVNRLRTTTNFVTFYNRRRIDGVRPPTYYITILLSIFFWGGAARGSPSAYVFARPRDRVRVYYYVCLIIL